MAGVAVGNGAAVISIEKLKIGAYYFLVLYEDRNPAIPVIETLRFKGVVSEEGSGKTLLLFDRVREHAPPQCRLTEDLLETSLFDFDGLVSELEASRADQQLRRDAGAVGT